MTITQLEYIIAVDSYRNFGQAASSCHVTQPTLSMQIQKLEEELDVKLFDRSKLPVIATAIGAEIIQQARLVVREHAKIDELISYFRGEVKGELHLAVIPTLAPYLVPLFVVPFLDNYPKVHLRISEMPTEEIIKQLRNNSIDCGLLATPLHEKGIQEKPLFYEPFVAYLSKNSSLFNKTTLRPQDLHATNEPVWLLDEGHCLRAQVMQLCRLRGTASKENRLLYQTGSLETLRRMVESHKGLTILPELSIANFRTKELDLVRYFKEPEPVREISLVTHRHFVKQGLTDALGEQIQRVVPEKMLKKKLVVPIVEA
ncbi:MAG: hydrogen peroxide-inducible genes activator [Chitinophagaceae bacterium]|nr:MAG: hydrogen peroxide-inducible genes activator [Chitinophagaceae bacterium]